MFFDLCVTLFLEVFLEEGFDLSRPPRVELLLELRDDLEQKVQSGFNFLLQSHVLVLLYIYM